MEELFEAHSRYERAMADIKSMNLSEDYAEMRETAYKDIAVYMRKAAMIAEIINTVLKPNHIPDEAAPNTINK